MTTENTLGPEVAEAEFARFAAAWRLDTDVSTMREEDRDSFEGLQRKLTGAIARGELTVSVDGEQLEYALQFPVTDGITQLTFGVPRGNAIANWDKFKDRQAIAKLNAYMGSMCKTNPAIFSQMDGRDLKIAQAVAQLFLGS